MLHKNSSIYDTRIVFFATNQYWFMVVSLFYKIRDMKNYRLNITNKFNLLKNGNVATTVWANETTKEIYPANRNSFGYNACYELGNDFYNKYGKSMKINQGKSNGSSFTYSARDMQNAGFKLVMRGSKPIW